MDTKQFLTTLKNFSHRNASGKVGIFAWYLTRYRGMASFKTGDIKKCFLEINAAIPASLSTVMIRMTQQKPPILLRRGDAYVLEQRALDTLDAEHGSRESTIHIHKILSDIAVSLTDKSQAAYLDEALLCFRHGAFRASVVMTWNLAFDHLCAYILDRSLTEFNQQLQKSLPKADIQKIQTRDDFSKLKEYQVLQVCNLANIIGANVYKIMKNALERRNIAAHPSGIIVSQINAEAYIIDLVQNAMQRLI